MRIERPPFWFILWALFCAAVIIIVTMGCEQARPQPQPQPQSEVWKTVLKCWGANIQSPHLQGDARWRLYAQDQGMFEFVINDTYPRISQARMVARVIRPR